MLKNVKIFLDKFHSCLIIYNHNQIAPRTCLPAGRGGKGFVGEKNMANGGLMTIDDLAGYLKVTRRTIYEWVKHNKIPAIKLVGQWRFKRDKIDAWIEVQAKPHSREVTQE
jgi:excisionase family DNA binding protein